MKIIIFGLNRNVVELVDMLVDNDYEILCIVPPTERKSTEYTKERLFGKKKIKVPIINTKNINEIKFVQKIKGLNCDLIINWEHTQIFSKELLCCSKIGALNFHRGLLPNARGFDPILGERLNDIEELGQTVHFMTEKIDKGKIVNQRSFKIDKKIYRVEIDQIFQNGVVEFYFDSIKKAIEGHTTDYEDSFGRYYPKPTISTEILDWQKNSNLILAQIRTANPFNPYVTFLSESYNEVKILKSEESDIEDYYSTCGQIIDKDKSLGNLVKTNDNAIWLTEIKINGEIQIPSFSIGTTFVSNWIHEIILLQKQIKNLEIKYKDIKSN